MMVAGRQGRNPMMDDKCGCGHWAMDHSEIGCENCMCLMFYWPENREETE